MARILPRIPEVYASIFGIRCWRGAQPDRSDVQDSYDSLARSATSELPGAATVLDILSDLPGVATHGDVQPNNVLADDRDVYVVDYESYGPNLPAIDIARFACNPAFHMTHDQRSELAREMFAQLAVCGFPVASYEQYSAACVYWAVSCASYFQMVCGRTEASDTALPEYELLAPRPLKVAAETWGNQSAW
ncbi:hypothetical protein GCM10022376_12560 [Yimella lutea]